MSDLAAIMIMVLLFALFTQGFILKYTVNDVPHVIDIELDFNSK